MKFITNEYSTLLKDYIIVIYFVKQDSLLMSVISFKTSRY